jgi:hypothetical protein
VRGSGTNFLTKEGRIIKSDMSALERAINIVIAKSWKGTNSAKNNAQNPMLRVRDVITIGAERSPSAWTTAVSGSYPDR